MFLIVGLGNPGMRYDSTRHNVGFDAIDCIAKEMNVDVKKIKNKAMIAECKIDSKRVILAKPQTYMNLSGESVSELMSYYKIESKNVLVIYDDIDLDVGKLRIRQKGSAGTHNGMKSIISLIKTQEFPRFRIGVGKPPKFMDLADYVLSKFSNEDKEILSEVQNRVVKAVKAFIEEGIDIAMNKYNG